MSSRTSSLSTLTTVPSTMSPSLKYLIVKSIAARNSSSEPMSLTATWGLVEVACVLLVVMCKWAPDTDRVRFGLRDALNPTFWLECLVRNTGRATDCPGGLPDHGGLHEITTHRSAYESASGGANSRPPPGPPAPPLRRAPPAHPLP